MGKQNGCINREANRTHLHMKLSCKEFENVFLYFLSSFLILEISLFENFLERILLFERVVIFNKVPVRVFVCSIAFMLILGIEIVSMGEKTVDRFL